MKTPRPKVDGPRRWGKGLRWMLTGVAVVAAVAVALTALRARSAAHKDEAAAGEQYWRVQRGPMLVSLVAQGQVKARETTEIKCQVRGDVKITWIVDEGTVVEKGDKLIELECSELQEKLVKQKINVATALADYNAAVQDLEIQKSKNRSDLLLAQNNLEMAKMDLQKYIEGDFKQKLREAESAIKLAEAEAKRAKDRLDGTEKLLAKQYVNRGEYEADKLALTKQEIELDKARNSKDLLEKYEYKLQTSKLQTGLTQAEEELKRVQKSAESELRTKTTLVESNKAKLDLEKYQQDDLEKQMANTVLYAPQSGMVVYPQGTGRNNENIRPEVGAQVRNQQKLIDLPDFSAWQVETRVHESRIQQVRLGQKALVGVDAFAGRPLNATVARISVLPDSSRWYMPDTKEYLVNLDLSTTTLPLKPGMSAKTEIVLNNLKNVLAVPIQAVSVQEGKTVVRVKSELGSSPRQIEVGQNNDRFVEVRSGLKEGDMVVMQGRDLGGSNDIFSRPSEQDEETDGKDGKQEEKKDEGKRHHAREVVTPIEKRKDKDKDLVEAVTHDLATSQTSSGEESAAKVASSDKARRP